MTEEINQFGTFELLMFPPRRVCCPLVVRFGIKVVFTTFKLPRLCFTINPSGLNIGDFDLSHVTTTRYS